MNERSGRVVRNWLAVSALVLLAVPAARAQDDRGVAVEPEDLTKRPDLIGKEVVVDDRVARFQFHPGRGFDEIYLRRSPDVAFELAPRIRPANQPSAAAVKVRGTLRKDKDRVWCEVATFDLLPADMDRLTHALAVVPKADVEKRTWWARWAERRGRAFQDEPLLARARDLEAEVVRLEGDRPPGRDPAAHWLALADRARAHSVPEPEPSAQAHRGFRALLGQAKSLDELQATLEKVSAFFPAAREPAAGAVDLSRWEKPYTNDAAAAYRAAGPAARTGLDRRLWADVVQQIIERTAAEDPSRLLSLAEDAAARLPERPQVASALLERGLANSSKNAGTMRQGEVDALAQLYRERLGSPERALALYRDWLDDQRRNRLSPRDADGRIALARQYETLLDDRATAVALLRDALAIDPQSREVTDAFLRRGFRKVDDAWVEGSRARAAVENAPDPAPGAAKELVDPPPGPTRSEGLRDATREEVRARLGGKPNRKIYSATQGRLVEQWIYFGARENQYITFVLEPGRAKPRVVSFYSLPRSASDSLPNP